MGNIVSFGPKKCDEIIEQHLSGMFVCGACHHEWEDVAPVGTTHVDCPNCGRAWGAAKNAVEPEYSWRCNCGESLFWLTPKGALCRRCGIITTDWAD